MSKYGGGCLGAFFILKKIIDLKSEFLFIVRVSYYFIKEGDLWLYLYMRV